MMGMFSAGVLGGVGDVGIPPAPIESAQPPHDTQEERQRPAGDRELPTAQNNSARNQATSVLKCWQKGRLIIEERDWRPNTNSTLPGPVLHARGGRFDTLRLGAFGDTFCYLKTAKQ